MPKFKATFVESIQRSPTSVSFRFIPEKHIDFKPGQFTLVLFDENNEKNKNINKYLSFSSAPYHDYFELTKRISDSEFSEALSSLKKGDEVAFNGPMGICYFEESMKDITFLIGGIGITAVISILEHIFTKKLNTNVSLFYSNRSQDDIAFKPELDKWAQNNERFKVFYTVTECAQTSDICYRGFITKELIHNHESDFNNRIIFVYGPPGMVNSMKDMCLDMSCSPHNLKTEGFLGY